VTLGIRSLFQEPTVAALATRLNAGPEPSHGTEVLLTLSAAGDDPPLFCVHPVTGLSWCYAGLARDLGRDRPVYGLQARGSSGQESLPASLAEMVNDYLDHIRKVQPEGPYHILGWSLGGNIAHAIACELQEQGEKVRLLALMDSYPMQREIGDQAIETTIDKALISELISREGDSQAQLESDFVADLAQVAAHVVSIVEAAIPRVYAGNVLFFSAMRSAGPAPEAWDSYIHGVIENHDIACEHLDMTRQAPLSEIARIISQALRVNGKDR
jgi:nonribosomal peptide synthetase DhbF